MNNIAFFTSFELGWFNAWIPSFGIVLIQFLYMLIYKEGGKRAVDTSWYTKKDRQNSHGSSFLQILLLIVSLFIPLKIGTWWFVVGTVIYSISLFVFIAAIHSYAVASADKTIKNGIYRYSRNPMYFAFHTGMLGVCIGSASLWLLLIIIPFFILTHWVILGEERYCATTYGEEYIRYKNNTPRYF
ncbi:methyltransferase family protein [Porphyromonas circumdentaria]|uniref:Phospholipid methyltransferase n=1 Tax=Porphyromonas circumdentaria TaxID=29524 RepID=A0A1T4PGL5_9PORP|nr:isoprenylcysteine carboxylmethyltransferase family protein [Porphyromonas circumdentaria]MBB6275717.1 protein-S-isoprenylcysteine O-methyltransferase Ste14 [Porphyromonas circumdentaria]MDO4722711.1 isoprenylcysteine carboxylmethyltransferase family protein [Porphyromonas circumdentaria]SJZ90376.1 Phospholipid methyltransferase [Porphyromonas circumdentaria]